MTETTAVVAAPQPENVAGEIQTAVRHTLMYGLGNVATKALGFLMVPLYTHYLAPHDYGTLEILDLTMSLFGMFLAMGMTAALLRCYAGADSDIERRKIVGTAFLFVIVTAAVAYSGLLGFVQPASHWIIGPSTPSRYLLLSFSAFIVGYVLNVPRTYLRAIEASGWFVAADTASVLLMLALNIIFLVLLKLGLVGILWSSLIVATLQLILMSVWLLRRIPLCFDGGALRKMLIFGLPLTFANMATFALNFSDRFFLQHLRSLEVVGVYAVGYKFGFMLNYLLVQPFYVMWQSRMYIIHKRTNHREVFGQMFVLYSFVLTYAGLGLAVLSPEIVRLMVDARFRQGQEVIPIVALAYIFYGAGYYMQLGMFLTDKTSHVGLVGAGAAVLNLALNYILVLKFGMIGAAWATVWSFAALAAASYWCSKRVLPLPLGIGRVSGGLALGVGLYMVSRLLIGVSLATTLAAKAAILAIFPVILWKVRLLGPDERATTREAATRALSGVWRLLGMNDGRVAG